jgi:YVTN family beta-propeller protein
VKSILVFLTLASSLCAAESYLSPVEIKLSPNGRTLYVVCEDRDALLAVDTQFGKVTKYATVGHKPKDLALSPDGRTLYVSNEWSDTVTELDALSLTVRRTLKTGWGPVGLTTDKAGATLYVANSIGDDVSLIDLAKGCEIKRLKSWRSPNAVSLSRDGSRVFVSNLLPHLAPYDQSPVSELNLIDTARQVVAERVFLQDAMELRHVAEAPPTAGGFLLVALMRPKNLNPLIQVQQGWFLTHGLGLIQPGRSASTTKQVLIDDIDQYYAGANGIAFTPDGRYVLVTSSEANVVSIFDTAKLRRRVNALDPADLPNRLDSARAFVVRRLKTGLNPTAIAVSPDGATAYIANHLDDSITVIDIARLTVRSTIDLGGPTEVTTLRAGERLFHDASFAVQGQLACFTCHPANHLDGVAWNLETPQLGRDRVANRTLRGIAETAPYKWNGHNPDLETQCGPRSARFIFHSEGFNNEQLKQLTTFIRSIPLPPNRHLSLDGELTAAQDRGKTLFFARGCATCHDPKTHYTTRVSADVGTAAQFDTSGTFDIPQLERVYEKPPYLHNGQALSLEQIWTVYSPGGKHGQTGDLAKEQLNDLVEFLKTL